MTPAQTDNFARLSRYPEHQAFRDWLQAEREKYRDQLELALSEEIYRCIQGKAQMLRELQNLMEKSENFSDKKAGR